MTRHCQMLGILTVRVQNVWRPILMHLTNLRNYKKSKSLTTQHAHSPNYTLPNLNPPKPHKTKSNTNNNHPPNSTETIIKAPINYPYQKPILTKITFSNNHHPERTNSQDKTSTITS